MLLEQSLPVLRDDFYIEEWWVQPSLNRLTRNGETRHLAPRFMQALQYLAAQPGRVIEREALLCAVWEDTVVEDSAVSQAIFQLRKALGDDSKQPRFIETIPKRGYRLIAAVHLAYDAVPDGSLPEPVLTGEVSPRVAQASPRLMSGPVVALTCALGVVLGLAVWNRVMDAPAAGPSPLHAIPVTSYPGLEMDPALSPDGRLAYAGRAPGEPRFNLYLKTLNAELPLQLTSTTADDVQPAWSPEGKSLAFIRLEDGFCWIMLMPVPGGPAREIAPCGLESHPSLAWSPKGDRLVVSDRPARGASYRLYMLSLDDRTMQPVDIPLVDEGGDRDPVFSPDGRTIAFTRTRANGTAEIYTYSLDTKMLRQWTDDEARIRGVTWSERGDGLLFASSRAGSMSIWHLDFAEDTPQWTGSEQGAYYPTAAQQGARFVYAQMSGDVNLWRIPLRPDTPAAALPQPLAPSSYGARAPQIAPDGSRIAFVSDRSGYAELWTCEADCTTPVQLTTLQGPVPRHPRWSPDGRTLVFEAHQGSSSTLYTLSAHGGLLQQLTDGDAIDRAPSWSRDGASVLFNSNRGGREGLWRISASGGVPVPLGLRGTVVQEGAEPDHIYYARTDTTGIWLFDSATDKTEQVVKALATEDILNWVVHEEGIYFVQRCSQELGFWNRATREVEILADLPPRLVRGQSLSFAPGGEWIVFAQFDEQESDIMLVSHLAD